MRTSLIVCFTGRDRPGLVDQVSKTALAHEANWEESRLARLAGQFAGIVHLTVDKGRAEALTKALRGLTELTVTVAGSADGASTDGFVAVQLELVGDDRPGIIREVSSTLARLEVNIEDLITERFSAPHSGDMLFKATARLRLPPRLDHATLRRALESIASELMVELTLASDERQDR